MNFNYKQKRRKSNGDKSLKKLLQSPAIMASGIPTISLSSDPNELCKRLNSLQREKQATKTSNTND